ncbi:hypothetical protein ACQJ5X_07815 [Helicobacter pylori]
MKTTEILKALMFRKKQELESQINAICKEKITKDFKSNYKTL